MERNEIARTDFQTSRRGYAREEVDRHLRAVAAEVARLEDESRRAPSLSGTAADRVREIIEAAERSATDIGSRAEEDAQRATERNTAAVREARQKAEARIDQHAKRVEDALDKALERATSLEADFERSAEALRSSFGALVGDLKGGAETVRAQLDEVRGSLPGAPDEASEGTRDAARTRDGGRDPSEKRPAPGRRRAAAKATRDQEAPKEGGSWAGPRSARGETTEPDTAERTAATKPGKDRAESDSSKKSVPAEQPTPSTKDGGEGARMIALNMALKGTPRDETARYLAGNFELEDPDAVVEEVYSKVRG